MHKVTLRRNSFRSEPWFPNLGQARVRYLLLALARGNFLPHKCDRFIQELDILRKVAAIGHFGVPRNNHRTVVDPVEHGRKGEGDSLNIGTARYISLAPEKITDINYIRMCKVNNRVAIRMTVCIMVHLNIFVREVNGDHVAKSYHWPSPLQTRTDGARRPIGSLSRHQSLPNGSVCNNKRMRSINRVSPNVIVM